ncbi:MAG TPA: FtsX-like permease family protein [Actinomycetota bacterium]|nr:FtsX-like permease family protein [Actinomycetota bacterium]
MWKLTLRNLRARKLRLAMTALAVVLGVGFVSGTFVLTDTMNSSFDNLFSDVNEGIDVVVRAESEFESQLGGSRSPIPDSLVATVRAVDGVEAAAGSVSGYAQFVDDEGEAVTTGGAPTLGASWYDEPQGSLILRDGRAPSGPDEVVVDAATARNHNFDVGDRVRIITQIGPREFQVSGIAGFGEADNLGGATLAVFDLATAQELFQKPGRLDSVDVAAEDGVTVEELQESLAEVLPDGVEATSASDAAAEQSELIKEALGFFNTALLIFSGISLFVGAFLIFNTFSITVAQRTREFALLRALGASGRQVTGAVFLEALLIGIFASVVGIVFGFGIAVALNALLSTFGIDLPNEGMVFLPRTALVAAVVGIGVTLVASIAPARRAARISPMAALRESAPRASRFSLRRTLIGLAVTLLGIGVLMAGLFADVGRPVELVGAGAFVTFLGVAVLAPLFAGSLANVIGAPIQVLRTPGKLARRNAARNPKRTAATAAALMIGLALVGLVSILGESLKASTNEVLDESLKADFTIAGGGFGAPTFISPEMSKEVAALPEVAAATPLRLGQFRNADERSLFAVGTDPANLDQVTDVEVTEGSLDDLGPDEVLLYHELAGELGLEVGDPFVMQFAATGNQEMTVAGIFENKSLIQSDYLLALSTFEANFPDRVDFQVLVKVSEGVSPAAARRAIENVLEDYPSVELEDQTETKERSASQVNQLLQMVNVLLAMSILIALFGITNTLALSVFERTRELGLLRAVGMARRQTRAMVRWEAVIISIIGAALGLVIGLFFGWALVTSLESEGITRLAIPYGQLAVYLLVAALAGVLAALPPARRAARLNVLEAISAE